MIDISIVRDSEGFIWEFTVSGHAMFAENGRDIICASVSVLAYNAINALSELVDVKCDYEIKDGFMQCNIPTDIPKVKKDATRIILETIIVGFKQIEFSYGNKYISVVDEEV